MATRAPTTSCNAISAIAVLAALGAMLIGCADPAALRFEQEAHADKVLAWCRHVSGARTVSLQQECVERAWADVPPSAFWTKYHGHAPYQTETAWRDSAIR